MWFLHRWRGALQLCRARGESLLWAILAALAVKAGQLEAANAAFASIDQVCRRYNTSQNANTMVWHQLLSTVSAAARTAQLSIKLSCMACLHDFDSPAVQVDKVSYLQTMETIPNHHIRRAELLLLQVLLCVAVLS